MRSFIHALAIIALVATSATDGAAQGADDAVVARRIAHNLKQSGRLKDYRVGVNFEDGVACMMGTVTSASQKQIAEQIVRNTPGVRQVASHVEITGQEAPVRPPVRTAASTFANRPAAPARSRPTQAAPRNNTPRPISPPGYAVQPANFSGGGMGGMTPYGGGGMGGMAPMPAGQVPAAVGQSVSYDNPQMPGYAWPSYASSPNYAALTYPQQYSPSAWPYIGPFYPYPQVPLGWRKVTLEWDDGWWFLDFKDCKHH